MNETFAEMVDRAHAGVVAAIQLMERDASPDDVHKALQLAQDLVHEAEMYEQAHDLRQPAHEVTQQLLTTFDEAQTVSETWEESWRATNDLIN